MKKLITIAFLIIMNTKGLAIPDSVLQSFPVEGMRGLSQKDRFDIDQFNKGMRQTGWGRIDPSMEHSYTGPIGNILPSDFGESKYDTKLAVQDVLSGDKTLNQLRAEKRAEDIEKYLKVILVASCVIITLIAVVLNRKHEK